MTNAITSHTRLREISSMRSFLSGANRYEGGDSKIELAVALSSRPPDASINGTENRTPVASISSLGSREARWASIMVCPCRISESRPPWRSTEEHLYTQAAAHHAPELVEAGDDVLSRGQEQIGLGGRLEL